MLRRPFMLRFSRELYLGQSIWLFTIGMVFYLVKYALDMTFLGSSQRFQRAYGLVERIGTGEATAKDGGAFMHSIGFES